MDFVKRIKELIQEPHFTGPRSVLDETGLIADKPQKPILDETGLVADEPFKPGRPIDDTPIFYHEA